MIPFYSFSHVYIFWMTPHPFIQLRKYLMDGIFLNQKKTNKNTGIPYSLKYKYSKVLYEKINGSAG